MTNEEFLFEVRLHRAITESKLKRSRRLMSEGRKINETIIETYKYDILACRLVEGMADELAKSGKLMQFNDHMESFFAKLPKVDNKSAGDFVKEAGIFQKISGKLKSMFSKSSLSDAVSKFYSIYPFYFDIKKAAMKLGVAGKEEGADVAGVIKSLPIAGNAKKYLMGAQEQGILDQVLNIEASDNPGSEFDKMLPVAGQMTSGEALKKFFSLGGEIAGAMKTTAQAAAAGVKGVAKAIPGVASGAGQAIAGGIKQLGKGVKAAAKGAAPGVAGAAAAAGEETAAAGGEVSKIASGITSSTSDDEAKAIVAALIKAKGAPAVLNMLKGEVSGASPFPKAIDEVRLDRLIDLACR